MNLTECTTTLSCLKIGSGVPRVCYKEVDFSDQKNFCDCSNWFGWTGEACDIPSSQLRYSIFSLLFLTLWGFLVMFLSGRTLIFHVENSFVIQSKSLNPIFFTGILVFLGAATITVYTLTSLPALFDSTRFEVNVYNDKATGDLERVTMKGTEVVSVSVLMVGIIYALISFQIVLSWHDVLQNVNLYRDRFNLSSKHMKLMIKAFLFFGALVSLVLLLTRYLVALYFFIAALAILVGILYFIGGFTFVNALRNLTEDGNHAIKIVTLCYKVQVMGLLMSSGLLIIFTILYYQIDAKVKPGNFNPASFSRDLLAASMLGLFTFDSWYVHIVSKRILKLSENTNWFPQRHSNITTNITEANETSGVTLEELGREDKYNSAHHEI